MLTLFLIALFPALSNRFDELTETMRQITQRIHWIQIEAQASRYQLDG